MKRGGVSSNDNLGVATTGGTSSFAPGEKYASAYSTTILSAPPSGLTLGQQQEQARPPLPPLIPVVPPPQQSYNNAPSQSPVSLRTLPSALSTGAFTATVKFTFIPSLPDELNISSGEVVTVLQEYDDGWALCLNGREVQGMVPVECLERERGADGNNTERLGVDYNGGQRNSRRESSLNVGGRR